MGKFSPSARLRLYTGITIFEPLIIGADQAGFVQGGSHVFGEPGCSVALLTGVGGFRGWWFRTQIYPVQRQNSHKYGSHGARNNGGRSDHGPGVHLLQQAQ